MKYVSGWLSVLEALFPFVTLLVQERMKKMDFLKQKDFKGLINTSGEWCVSLYMPAHRVGREQQQDTIRFKNLATRAQEELLALGLSTPKMQKLLEPAEKLSIDRFFWQHQSDGLAVFLSDNFSKSYRLPLRFDELLVITKSFHIKPLLPLLGRDKQFYILAISINEIRLLHATRDTIDEVELEGVSTNMQEALWMDNPGKHLGFHTSASSPGREGLRQAVFYGHGAKSAERKKVKILRYFQNVNDGLNRLLEGQNIPMVLVGVDYLQPIYREANTYPDLLESGRAGNPEQLSEQDLHRMAWELVEPIFTEERQRAVRKFAEYHGQENRLASTDLQSILQAANGGRVATMFVALNEQIWGRFDDTKNILELHPKFHPGDRDLLDLAAELTWLNGGDVYTLEPDQVPGGSFMAAIHRYEY
jgi:hypothetical protein